MERYLMCSHGAAKILSSAPQEAVFLDTVRVSGYFRCGRAANAARSHAQRKLREGRVNGLKRLSGLSTQ